jgi:hypothetical protein
MRFWTSDLLLRWIRGERLRKATLTACQFHLAGPAFIPRCIGAFAFDPVGSKRVLRANDVEPRSETNLVWPAPQLKAKKS